MSRNTRELLIGKWKENKNLCVGLDPDVDKIPHRYSRGKIETTLINFCCSIVDETAGVAAAYKPNRGFFGYYGDSGMRALQTIVCYVHERCPDIPVIIDGKYNDIGNTLERYAGEAFNLFACNGDAMTANPYLGQEANEPILRMVDKFAFWLCLTSNPGAGEFQKYGNPPLFLKVAENIQNYWNGNNNCGLVIGATCPEELAEVREAAPELPLLLPGVGKQNGDLEGSVSAAKHSFLINSSRGIIYAENPKESAHAVHEQIQVALKEVNKWKVQRIR